MSDDEGGTVERWWICTDELAKGGTKILGPFESRSLAMDVRKYVEQVNAPTTYWVDNERSLLGRPVNLLQEPTEYTLSENEHPTEVEMVPYEETPQSGRPT